MNFGSLGLKCGPDYGLNHSLGRGAESTKRVISTEISWPATKAKSRLALLESNYSNP